MERRDFIKKTVTVGTGSAFAPVFISKLQAGMHKLSPGSALRIGLLGSGRMGTGNMNEAMAAGLKEHVNARVVAVCDVDSKRTANARRVVQEFEKERNLPAADVREYGDFRELLQCDDIDAVIIATPDNWHALMGIESANAGKHVYLQKPLTYTIPEGQALVKAVRKNKIVLQTGSQQRSSVYFRQVCTIVRNNWLGALKQIDVEVPTDQGRADYVPMEVPSNLDYDMWLGPCPVEPYTESRVHPQDISGGFGRPGWLQIQRYCLGMITGWGSHMYDIAQWAMGTDTNSGPVEFACWGDFPDRGLFDVHVHYQGEAAYPNGVKLFSRNGSPGVRFIMEGGWAYCARGRMECSDPSLLRRKPAGGEVELYHSDGHMEDFLTSIRAGKDPICPVEVGHRSNSICVLHHLSMKANGRKFKWDPEKEQPVNDSGIASMMHLPMRKPWKL